MRFTTYQYPQRRKLSTYDGRKKPKEQLVVELLSYREEAGVAFHIRCTTNNADTAVVSRCIDVALHEVRRQIKRFANTRHGIFVFFGRATAAGNQE